MVKDKTALNKRLNSLPKHRELYSSYKWKQLVKDKISEHPYCSDPFSNGCHDDEGLELHHIIQPFVDGVLNEFLAYDESNLIVVCQRCHRMLSMRQARDRRINNAQN